MADVRDMTWLFKAIGFSEAKRDVEELNKSVDKSKKSMLSLGDLTDKAASGLSAAGKKMQDFGGKMSKLGGKITKFTAPLTLAGGAAFKWSNDVDTALRQVSTLTSDEILPVSKIKKEVKEMSDASGRSMTEVANGMYEALSSGVDESKVKEFTQKAITLSEAGFTDMSTAIDATTTVLNAYGEKAYDVGKISDIFVQTQNKGKITVGELASSIGRVIPTAAAANVNVDQLGAAYSVLTAKGMNARIATTNLQGMLSELSTTGSNVDQVLRMRTNKSFAELTEEGMNLGEVLDIVQKAGKEQGLTLKDMFSQTTAGSAALSLMSDGVEGYTSALNDMNNAQGIAEETAKKMHGPGWKWQRIVTSIKNTMTDFGDAIAPVLLPIAESFKELTEKFRNLSPESKQMIVEWGMMVVAAGPVIGIFGKVAQGIGWVFTKAGSLIHIFGAVGKFAIPKLVTALKFLGTKMGVIGLIISGVVGLGVRLYKNWGKISARAQELGGGLKGYLGAALEDLGDMFTGLWNKAKSALDGIKGAWGSLKEFVKHPITGTINFVKDKLGGKKDKELPSHASGLNTVPFDNYQANLHGGEMVLTSKAANLFRSIGGTKDRVPVYNISNNSSVNNSRYNEAAPNITINIDVKGGADKKTADDIGQAVRREIDAVFRKVNLQRV